MDQQVVPSERKLNLRRDLQWVAKQTQKFPCKYTQVTKTILRQTSSISLANNGLMDVTQLALTWLWWLNGGNLL